MPTEQAAPQSADKELSADARGELAPGNTLQEERMRRGFSEKEVAERLHITMHYVKALEANQFEKLPGAVFAKGYIKSYARLLRLDEGELLHQYEELHAQQQSEKEDAGIQQVQRKKDRNRPWVIASIVGFTGGFLGLWAYNNFFVTESNEEVTAMVAVSDRRETVEDSPVNADQPAAPTLDNIETIPELATPQLATDSITVVEEAAVQSANAIDFVAALVSLSAGDQPADETTVFTTEPPQDVAVATASPIATQSSEGRIIEINAAGDDILRITFSGESWIEVNDSEANQIYRNIHGAGDVLEITGNAPFNILLGDAPFTRLSLNGTEIDVSDNIRIDNSARLTVGL